MKCYYDFARYHAKETIGFSMQRDAEGLGTRKTEDKFEKWNFQFEKYEIGVAPEGVPKHPVLNFGFWILLGIFWLADVLSSEPLVDASGSWTTAGLARL